MRAILGCALLILISSPVFSFPTYEGCKDCHGGFKDGTYMSNKDGSNWGTDLMDAHEAFVSGNCNACHKSGSKGEVFLNFSIDNTFSMSCTGCHGRVEDVNNICTGIGGGMEVNCGSGVGLRRHHEAEVGTGTCNSCHSSNPKPVGEHIAPFNYGRSSITIADSCNADGTESKFGATGLDNDGDGNLLTDGDDPDCQSVSNTPPTQPGTLSATSITSDSATVSWGASTDVDDDTISYLVEYRRNGDIPWINGGNTNSTSRSLSGLDSSQSYDVQVTPNDATVDGTVRTALNLLQTLAAGEIIFSDSFE